MTGDPIHRAAPESSADGFDAAFDAARRAAAEGEVPVGAVVVRDGRILAVAHNRPRALCDPTAHAEILAIRAACTAIGGDRLVGCDLYVTLEPCPMCAGAISLSRIRRLYYAAADPKGGGVEHGPRVFNQPTCHHAPEVYGGFRETEAASLLRAFFAIRRDCMGRTIAGRQALARAERTETTDDAELRPSPDRRRGRWPQRLPRPPPGGGWAEGRPRGA